VEKLFSTKGVHIRGRFDCWHSFAFQPRDGSEALAKVNVHIEDCTVEPRRIPRFQEQPTWSCLLRLAAPPILSTARLIVIRV